MGVPYLFEIIWVLFLFIYSIENTLIYPPHFVNFSTFFQKHQPYNSVFQKTQIHNLFTTINQVLFFHNFSITKIQYKIHLIFLVFGPFFRRNNPYTSVFYKTKINYFFTTIIWVLSIVVLVLSDLGLLNLR